MENDAFQIPDAVFGSAGSQSANVAVNGELIVFFCYEAIKHWCLWDVMIDEMDMRDQWTTVKWWTPVDHSEMMDMWFYSYVINSDWLLWKEVVKWIPLWCSVKQYAIFPQDGNKFTNWHDSGVSSINAADC